MNRYDRAIQRAIDIWLKDETGFSHLPNGNIIVVKERKVELRTQAGGSVLIAKTITVNGEEFQVSSYLSLGYMETSIFEIVKRFRRYCESVFMDAPANPSREIYYKIDENLIYQAKLLGMYYTAYRRRSYFAVYKTSSCLEGLLAALRFDDYLPDVVLEWR